MGGAKLWCRVLRGQASWLFKPSQGGVEAPAQKRAARQCRMTVKAGGQIQMRCKVCMWKGSGVGGNKSLRNCPQLWALCCTRSKSAGQHNMRTWRNFAK